MKYILVTGGVISGIGKGIISSSIGAIMKGSGVRVTSIKIDPYLNIDAGTFSPYEHGEVFVLDDGGEVDLDLGNYERFMDVTLSRDHNLTTGKVYQDVIERERRGEFLGKTVQVVPHITNAIQEWIMQVARKPVDGSALEPELCIIELGGTIGDIESMPFVEAFRQFQFRVGPDNFMLVHVSLLPEPSPGEQKSKPTQHGVRELRGLGLNPDVIACRSVSVLHKSAREKISMFCHVPPDQVIGVHNMSSIYRVPPHLEAQNILSICQKKLGLPVKLPSAPVMEPWMVLAERYENMTRDVRISLVGKYTKIGEDAYSSVVKSLWHSCLRAGRKLTLTFIEASDLEKSMLEKDPEKYHKAWSSLVTSHGVLVPGGFGSRGIEGMIAAAQWARTKRVPFLGVCLGMQIAVIEFARSELGWADANSTEFDPQSSHPVVVDMPEVSQTILGGTMRLGKRRTLLVKRDSLTVKLYNGAEHIDERHRHRFEVKVDVIKALEEKGMCFVGQDSERVRMEVMELTDHPFFVGSQFHPEYLTRPHRPPPLFFGFILAACGQLQSYLATPDSQANAMLPLAADTPPSLTPASSTVALDPEALVKSPEVPNTGIFKV